MSVEEAKDVAPGHIACGGARESGHCGAGDLERPEAKDEFGGPGSPLQEVGTEFGGLQLKIEF